ncbi:CAP domain-containing protein [Jannaschia sp.]|nr:CAP domain-containing protein [Jannaschia sp.]
MMRFLVMLCLSSAPAVGDPLVAASQARAAAGLPGLRGDAVLFQMAQIQADHMAARRRIGHDGPGGSSLADRARSVGHRPCWLAENVAGGQRSLRRVMRDWLRSPGHRANILNPRMRSAAVAHARGRNGRLYWAMVLAGPC